MALSSDTPTTLQDKLSHLVQANPAGYISANGELVIPAHALLSILHSLSTDYDIALLKPHEEENLAATLVGIPDYELTPAAMIGLFETLSGGDSSSSALAPSNSIGTSGASSASSSSDDFALDADESDAAEFAEERRDTVVETKKKPSLENLFDVRERSSPLPAATLRKRPPRLRGRSETTFTTLSGTDHNVTPKPTSASNSRRNSVAGHYSHHRMLSNPTSPVISPSPAASSPSSPLFGFSRLPPTSGTMFSPQHSHRSLSPDTAASTPAALYEQSFSLNPIPSPDFSSGGTSPNNGTHISFASFASPTSEAFPVTSDEVCSQPHSSEQGDGGQFEDSFELEYVPEPELQHSPLGEDDPTIHSSNSLFVHNPLHRPLLTSIGASSTHSAANEERIEALQKANASLAKKLRETTRELEHKLGEHEAEVEELQQRIDDLKTETAVARHKEKELKVKERASTSQLANLEADMSKLQRQLEASRASYQALQKQYQERCGMAEKYRETVYQKEQEIKRVEEANIGHQAESAKWKQERDNADVIIGTLRAEVAIGQQAQFNLDEQKVVNLALKETIDRLRLDLDEIRNTPPAPGSFGPNGGFLLLKDGMPPKPLPTLDVELGESMRQEEHGDIDPTTTAVATPVDGEADIREERNSEESIITTRRRRPAHHRRSLPAKFTASKHLADATTQHDASDHTVSAASQTSPVRLVSISSQTSPQASPPRQFLSPPSPPSPLSCDVFDATLCDDDGDDSASSSSMTLAAFSPSPSRYVHASSSAQKMDRLVLLSDRPPSYAHLEAEERQNVHRQFRERWNANTSPTRMIVPLPLTTPSLPISPLSHVVQRLNVEDQSDVNVDEMSLDEVSREAVEKWKSLKRELGFECRVIDRALLARHTPAPSPSFTHDTVDPDDSRLLVHEMERRMRTLTPRLAREWADQVKAAADAEEAEQAGEGNGMDESNKSTPAPRTPAKKQRSPRWQFYNMYNPVFYPTTDKEDTPKRHWNVTLTSVGVWALVFMTAAVLPAALRSEYGNSIYTDRQLWSQYNSVGQVSPFDGGLPQPGPANDALWTLAENLLVGAANVVRRAPPT